MPTVRLSPVFIMAHLWLSKWHGCGLVPYQPGSKCLVRGFGIHQQRIETGEQVSYWFQDRNTNLGVIAPENGLVLDFDDLQVYYEFCKKSPELASSYTESTPRSGRHVFLLTSSPMAPGLVLVKGLEIKTLVLVYPSQIGTVLYRMAVQGPILTSNVQEALGPFIQGERDKLPTLPAVRVVGRSVVKKQYKTGGPQLVQTLKARWPIIDYLAFFEPNLILTGKGRWLHGRCPWHEGHHVDSLWVDQERNTWGCHTENIGGDIIDWHKRRLGNESISKTIKDLARYQLEVSHV